MLSARRSKLTFALAFLLASLLCQASLPVVLAAKASAAANKQTFYSLEANLGTVEGYNVTLSLFKSGGNTSGGVNLEKNFSFNRQFSQFTGQAHSYSFPLPKTGFTVGRVPKTAQIDSGDALGDTGSLKGRFTGNDPVRKNSGGCGTLKLSKGNINGTFEFDTHDQPFGKITVQKGRATLTKHVFDPNSAGCQADSNVPCVFDGLELSGSSPEGPGIFNTLLVYKKGSNAFFTASSLDEHPDDVFVFRSIGVEAPGSALTAADDLKSASATAPGGPITGTGSYSSEEKASKEDVNCGNVSEKVERTFGQLTGDLTAHFDVIGDVVYTSSGVLTRKV